MDKKRIEKQCLHFCKWWWQWGSRAIHHGVGGDYEGKKKNTKYEELHG